MLRTARHFFIILDTNRQVFYPGETISGHVVVNLQSKLHMRGVKVEFEGKSLCKWKDQRLEDDGQGGKKHVPYFVIGEQKHIEYTTWLYGSVMDGPQNSLPNGVHKYPFVFTVPPNLPSSFEGRYGRIRYEIKASIEIPGRKDLRTRRLITLNSIIDPNNPDFKMSPCGSVHKQVGCLCWKAGTLEISASVDRECYCPGELMFVNANIQNNTNRDMPSSRASLVQMVAYLAAGGKKKYEEHIVCSVRGPRIVQGETDAWENKPFPLPAVPPTIRESRIITVAYKIKFEVEVPRGFNPKIDMNIILGTVPFKGAYGVPQQYSIPSGVMPEHQPSLENVALMPPAPSNLLGHPDMAPPSYAAAVGSTKINCHDDDDGELYGDASYVPVYTFAQPYTGNLQIQRLAEVPSEPIQDFSKYGKMVNMNNPTMDMHNAGMNMHNAGMNTHSPGMNVHNAGMNMHSQGMSMHNAGKNIHNTGMNVHNAGMDMHNAGMNVHNAGKNMHNTGKNMHNTGMNVHNAGMDMHNAGMNMYNPEMNMHNPEMGMHSTMMGIHEPTMGMDDPTMNMHESAMNMHDTVMKLPSIDEPTF